MECNDDSYPAILEDGKYNFIAEHCEYIETISHNSYDMLIRLHRDQMDC